MSDAPEHPDDWIPPRIINLIRGSPSWDSRSSTGRIVLGAHQVWHPLVQASRLAPTVAGVYAIALDCRLQYPLGNASIVYLGSSKNLNHRLKTHGRRSHNEMIRRSLATGKHSLTICWAPVPGLPPKWLTALESECIRDFIRKFGTCPCFNQGCPESIYAHRCSGLISANQPPPAEPLIKLQNFAAGFGLVCTMEASSMGPLAFTAQVGTEGYHFDVERIPIIRFAPQPDTAHASYPQQSSCDVALDEHRSITTRSVPNIYQEHCAEWPAAKVAQILRITQRLIDGASDHAALVYAASDSELPESCTWGEVALVLGRLAAGTWFPRKRLCVTIHCAQRVLGHASLYKREMLGFDFRKGDKPMTDRPSFWTRWEQSRPPPIWQERVERSIDEDGIEETGVVREDIRIRDTVEQDRNAAQAAMDRAVEDRFKEAQRLLEDEQSLA